MARGRGKKMTILTRDKAKVQVMGIHDMEGKEQWPALVGSKTPILHTETPIQTPVIGTGMINSEQPVYGLHTIDDRRSLWGKLRSINLRQQGPWMSMGDYNVIHKAEDRLIGSTIHKAETKDFDSFLKDTRMAILRANGREFTWNNGHTYNKIDWALHGEFQRTVQMAWQQSHNTGTMYGVWQKLKRVKIALKELNIAEYQGVETRIKMYRHQLHDLQNIIRQPGQSTDILQLEKEVKENLEKWLNIEESILKQKSIVQWLQLGDVNTSYFHSSLKNRIV
ncbi:uncharacterized protein LOC125836395 [Solanum verrucosum]|uniref:uncharacterized protein LOC125836395 n=1 Tax=Solanum verrucosum TaxID=315347 RepID=UPI0020D192BD|nr:uncharacterized protein LOC125836395 [Solanum verrucosum]